jgi:dTDP-4-dehydrorhamnose 3,5-epimerase
MGKTAFGSACPVRAIAGLSPSRILAADGYLARAAPIGGALARTNSALETVERAMIFHELPIQGSYFIELDKKEDERGFFARSFCSERFRECGLIDQFVQHNVSWNRKKGTLRGMHYQEAPYGEAKLIRCIQGAIYDVFIDMRPKSPTYKQWFGKELSSKHHALLYIPAGCAHGFQTMKDDTEVLYQSSCCYTPHAERGIRWNDPAFKVQWPLTPTIVSAKDRNHPLLPADKMTI